MTATNHAPDPTMEAICNAMALGYLGHIESARRDLMDIWRMVGVVGDPFHRCTLAHYLADLFDHPAEALIWDVRALDAADALTDESTQQHDANLEVAGFYPSLHLNVADNLRRLAAFDAAAAHIDNAEQRASALPDDDYGNLIRTAISEVRHAIDNHDTAQRSSAPGAAP
ncbi:MAG: hypothetical protein LCH96_14850 [Actinobacteria bacterium]|nr:hypothetical protein [Actinomycetota bacterium]